MSKTRWIIFAVVCVLILGGLVLLGSKNKQDVSSIDPSKIIPSTSSSIGDHVFGNANAKVIVYEYGDFQCPSCEGAYPQLKTIKNQYKDQIAFVFRDFPLTTIHPNALAAATAAEAAGVQGKFWQMHDALYDNQTNWSSASTSERNDIFEGYAQSVGVNIDQYRRDLVSKQVTDKINRDRALGKKLNLDSTPSVLINSQKMDSNVVGNLVQGDGSQLKAEIDKALKAVGVQPPAAS